MTVSELILQIDGIVGLGVKSRLDSSQEVGQAMENDSCCNTLLACCNFVLDDLYASRALSCKSTVVQATNGLINTAELNMGKALSLLDSVGNSVPFKSVEDGLAVNRDGKYNLTYARKSVPLNFADAIPLPNSQITYNIFLYGVVAEYFRIEGDYAQSESWANKYIHALDSALSDKTNVRLPRRRWLT